MNEPPSNTSDSNETTFDLGENSEYLIAWVSQGIDRGPEIHIYGNPAGLRDLASKLIAMAEYDQRLGGFPDDDSEHHHYRTGRNTDVADHLPMVTIGRVDSKKNKKVLRDCFPPLLTDAKSSAIT